MIDKKFEELLGKTLIRIDVVKSDDAPHKIKFHCDNGAKYILFHEQDCCESVWIEDICGDINDLLNTHILIAEEVVGDIKDVEFGDQQYSFYKLATIKGNVTIRWCGESNGYYSTRVDFIGTEDLKG